MENRIKEAQLWLFDAIVQKTVWQHAG